MITLIIGENAYERDRAVASIVADFEDETERYDGVEISVEDIRQFMQGLSLFATKRLIIIKNLSENKAAWEEMAIQADNDSADTHIVLIEPKPDKRTKAYKTLHQYAKVSEHKPFNERDTGRVTSWVKQVAASERIDIAPEAISELVRRVGVDQYQLYNELTRLSVLGTITKDVVEAHTELSSHDNVFTLLSTALEGDNTRLHQKIATLQLTNDPYMTFGLLSAQIFQLSALVLVHKPPQETAQLIGASPFVLHQLSGVAKQLTTKDVRRLANLVADADIKLKTASRDPWVVIEATLLSIGNKNTRS